VYLFVLSYLAAAGFWFKYLSDIYLTQTLKNCSFFADMSTVMFLILDGYNSQNSALDTT